MLVPKARNDKSKFLAQAGFTLQNPEALQKALETLITTHDAEQDKQDVYGTFYRVEGILDGVNGIQLKVITIWLRRQIDNKFQFITLKPNKEV